MCSSDLVRPLHVALVDEHGDLASRRDLITAPQATVDARRDACRAETRSDQLGRRLVIRERDTDLCHVGEGSSIQSRRMRPLEDKVSASPTTRFQ